MENKQELMKQEEAKLYQKEYTERVMKAMGEIDPILQKYDLTMGAQSNAFLNEEGVVKVSCKPVLVDTKKLPPKAKQILEA